MLAVLLYSPNAAHAAEQALAGELKALRPVVALLAHVLVHDKGAQSGVHVAQLLRGEREEKEAAAAAGAG